MRNTADKNSSMPLAMFVSVGLVLGAGACKKSSDQPATQAGYPPQAPNAVPVQQAPGYGTGTAAQPVLAAAPAGAVGAAPAGA
ncbi:MAG TPA: hypothetical protein VHW01_25145, partial [Polyangiaceae bacterium]|nr:hypothetical protein [Polyangiaceae bacterium]